METEYVIILITLLFSAFFSGMEIAFVSANKFKIFLDKEKGTLRNKIVSKFTEKPSNFIVSMLIGNNIALVIYGIYMALLSDPIIQMHITTHQVVLYCPFCHSSSSREAALDWTVAWIVTCTAALIRTVN